MSASRFPAVNTAVSPFRKESLMRTGGKDVNDRKENQLTDVESKHILRTQEAVRRELSSFDGGRKDRHSFEPKEKAVVEILPVLSKSAKLGSRPSAANKRPATLAPPKAAYKYKLVPGNNSRVILSCFRKRPWWHSSNNDKKKNKESEEATKGKEKDKDKDKKKESVHEKTVINFEMVWEMSRNPKRYKYSDYMHVVLNHIEDNRWLVSKKYLYFSLRDYCTKNGISLLDIVPRTFYLAPGEGDDKGELKEFGEYNTKTGLEVAQALPLSSIADSDSHEKTDESAQGVIWILKPASYANRGFGIKVVRGYQAAVDVTQRASSAESSRSSDSAESTHSRASSDPPSTVDPFNMTKRARDIARNNGWICQEYMSDPLLVSGRKFDIRCYMLIVNSTKEGFKAYWYRDGYVRTSCKKYSLAKLSDRETHLTNDAVQKHAKSYGKFESGNKLSYSEWQEVINKDYPGSPGNVVEMQILPRIKELAKLSVLAALDKGLAKTKIQRSFELLGFDFMITSNFEPRLIEINTNPCLEFACPLLESLIGGLIDNVWKVAVDGFFKPPEGVARTKATEEAVQKIESEPDLFEVIVENTAFITTTSGGRRAASSVVVVPQGQDA